jgi:signal transduction histidine kinase
MKLIKVLSFFFIVFSNTSCEVKEKQELDEVLEKSNYEKVKKSSTKYSKLNMNDSAIYCVNKFIENNKFISSSQLGNLSYRKGYYYNKNKQYDSAYYYISKSLEEYLKINDSIKIGERLFSIAKIESDFDMFLKSDSTSVEALKYLNNSPKANEVICSIYNCLGINSRNQGGYHDAIKYYNKAIQITNDSLKRVRYIANKAVVYKYEKNYKGAVKVYEELIKNKFFDEIDLKLKFKILDNYTYTKYLLGEKVDVNDFFKVQRLKDSIKNYAGLITNYSYLSDYFNNQNPDKSLFYAQKMYNLSRERKRPNDRIEAIDKLIKLVKGNEIRKYAIERNYLKDSIVDARRKSTNKLVKTIYNFDLLKEQKLKAEIKTEQQKSQKQLWIFTVILTILSSIVYFFYKREKTKKEKAIEVYNTETRLAKKIHDELANDVYAVMNTLQNTSITDERLLTRVEKIYAQTRDISHENSPVLTGEHFESFLKQLFLDFTNDRCKVIHKGLQEVNINQLAKEKQIVVYRALQELLVNMKKYSEATLVLITFSVEKNKLSIAYQDNGIGVENLSVKNGLQNMEIRIKSVGGFITFESKQEKGFQAKFQFKK